MATEKAHPPTGLDKPRVAGGRLLPLRRLETFEPVRKPPLSTPPGDLTTNSTTVVPPLTADALPETALGCQRIGPRRRPKVRGKFIFVGEEKLYIRGVTYGTFRPDSEGHEYPSRPVVESDFTQMAANGFNALRTYTMPPVWLLDAAARHGLRVMVSLAIERDIGYLADRQSWPARVERRWRDQLEQCTGHPAILGYAIGNEIPAATVRWLGARRVERLLGRLCDLVRKHDPEGIVTYVNYPTAEYLRLPFLDLVCFNVYLEFSDTFDAYLGRLQNIAGSRPLLMGEIGLDSLRSSEARQAEVLDWQIRRSFRAGCAGAFVYAWTDEWHRGGEDVEDWAFGLVDRGRCPKPALSGVRRAYEESAFDHEGNGLSISPSDDWPKVSVIVCSYNGESRIRDCCEGLLRIEYPNVEVIVVDDGSTDRTGDTAEFYGLRVIRTPNLGLGNARNVGLDAATGEIVAYLDDDAYPDPHWLHYLAVTFQTSDYVGVGGPNLVPVADDAVAQSVAMAPGGPVHVLLSDREAEHIPGCNMAFRRDALRAIGGFDTQFRVAGDDVDVCWRLQDRGWGIGFSPAAVVWHHRRNSVRAYWNQQKGYGKAEALLEAKWPHKYTLAGHARWSGRIYDEAMAQMRGRRRWRIYHGVWGTEPFQFLYEHPPGPLSHLPQMPEWLLVNLALVLVALAGLSWKPLLWTSPLAVAAAAIPVIHAIRGAMAARFSHFARPKAERLQLQILTGFLYVIQPLARLHGRLLYGLAPWRQRGVKALQVPRARTVKLWTDVWRSTEDRLRAIEADLRTVRHFVVLGGESDPWDLEVRSGFLGGARVLAAAEEHGAGCQTLRYRVWPKPSVAGVILVAALIPLAAAAAHDGAWIAAGLLGLTSVAIGYRTILECSSATSSVLKTISKPERPAELSSCLPTGTRFRSAEPAG